MFRSNPHKIVPTYVPTAAIRIHRGNTFVTTLSFSEAVNSRNRGNKYGLDTLEIIAVTGV